MDRLPLPRVHVDLRRIADNVGQIRRRTGVDVLAVVKCDAYGLGAAAVVRAIADVADGFVFNALHEAIDADVRQTGKPSLTLSVPLGGVGAYREHGVRPAVWTVDDAREYRAAGPLVNIDTGMQRFACPVDRLDAVVAAGDCREAMTHATSMAQVEQFGRLTTGDVDKRTSGKFDGLAAGEVDKLSAIRFDRRHAAGSSLLNEPKAWLDAVRPGLAIYRDAVRVSVPLIDVRKTRGPGGYTGFAADWHGVIPMGYAHGLRPGPCRVGGRDARVIEVGMQSAFVTLRGDENPGDEVVVLGDGMTPNDLSAAWGVSPQEVLVRLGRSGQRVYARV